MPKLTIIRGPAGSGKTTHAKSLGGIARKNWFEADMFHEHNGHYKFEATLIGAAHAWCQHNVRQSLENGQDTIVSNTTCSMEELGHYLKIAEETGAELSIIRTPRPWLARDLKDRNIHNVPLKTIEKMINKYVEHPDEIELERK